MSRKSLFGKTAVLIIIAAMGVVLLFLTLEKENIPEKQQILPVKIIYAKKGDLEKLLRISGFIESETMVTVLPRIGGILTGLYVEMGDSVHKDQIIGSIDSEPYDLAFNQAKDAFLVTQSTFTRVSSLYTSKSVSVQNYDEAKANYDAMKSNYELAELNLSYTELKSPISGVVLERHVSQGSMVSPQVPVVTIGDINKLKVNSAVPEVHYSFFQKNKEIMDIRITVPALANKQFTGKISNIAPFISAKSRNFVVKCQIIGEETLLRPGMFVYLDFVLEKRENIYSLPYRVLIGGDSLWYVDNEEKARKLLYSYSFGNNEFFQISSDISAYRFIIEGQNFLIDGQNVRILEDS